jgi:N utilization substance protein B
MSKSKEVENEICARRVSLWMLFAMDLTGRDVEELLFESYGTLHDLEPNLDRAWERVEARITGVNDAFAEVNAAIQKVSPRWKLERMAIMDRNILRLGAWELLNDNQPPIAVINACIELAKTYGEKGTPAFVNGLLDELCKSHKITVSRA